MSDFIIAVDFDGTIVDHCFPDIGRPVPGAFAALRDFMADGAKLILWTMRSDRDEGPFLTDAVNLCLANYVVFWGINKNPTQHTWTTSPKVYANVYIDDAAAGCPLRANPRFSGRPYVDWHRIGLDVGIQISNHNQAKKMGTPT